MIMLWYIEIQMENCTHEIQFTYLISLGSQRALFNLKFDMLRGTPSTIAIVSLVQNRQWETSFVQNYIEQFSTLHLPPLSPFSDMAVLSWENSGKFTSSLETTLRCSKINFEFLQAVRDQIWIDIWSCWRVLLEIHTWRTQREFLNV